MNKFVKSSLVVAAVALVAGTVYFGWTMQQRKTANTISQAYSQIVYPANFIRTYEQATVRENGLIDTQIHLYQYRATAPADEVPQQVEKVFENAGYQVTGSPTQIEGTDKQLKLTAVLEISRGSNEHVVKVVAEKI